MKIDKAEIQRRVQELPMVENKLSGSYVQEEDIIRVCLEIARAVLMEAAKAACWMCNEWEPPPILKSGHFQHTAGGEYPAIWKCHATEIRAKLRDLEES